MDEKALFTQFWTDESQTTQKVLSRIPEGSDYRPDPKSRTAQEIAWQIVCEEKMIIDALEQGKAEWNPPPMPASMKDVLKAYEVGAGLNVTVRPGPAVLSFSDSIAAHQESDATTYETFLKLGSYGGRDAIGVCQEAIDVWERYLQDVETAARERV